jgi:hypothetical protein
MVPNDDPNLIDVLQDDRGRPIGEWIAKHKGILIFFRSSETDDCWTDIDEIPIDGEKNSKDLRCFLPEQLLYQVIIKTKNDRFFLYKVGSTYPKTEPLTTNKQERRSKYEEFFNHNALNIHNIPSYFQKKYTKPRIKDLVPKCYSRTIIKIHRFAIPFIILFFVGFVQKSIFQTTSIFVPFLMAILVFILLPKELSLNYYNRETMSLNKRK